MAWRNEIKTFFADMASSAIPDMTYFGAWNNQKTSYEEEETKPPLGVFFEYSEIGEGLEYLLQRDMQQSEKTPVEVTLHIMFDCYNEQHQEQAYDYAEKITCEINGRKHEKIAGRIMKSFEREDINHNVAYDYQMGFAFHIKDAVFNSTLSEDANPETEIDPNPDTGRALKVSLTTVLDK